MMIPKGQLVYGAMASYSWITTNILPSLISVKERDNRGPTKIEIKKGWCGRVEIWERSQSLDKGDYMMRLVGSYPIPGGRLDTKGNDNE